VLSNLSAAARMICFVALLAGGLSPTATAQQASTSQLETQLGTIFKVTRVDSVEHVVLNLGSVVTVTKSNLLFETPMSQPMLCTATVKETTDQVASAVCRLTMKGTGNFLQAGQRLFVTKIKATVPRDTVTLELSEAAVDPATGETGHPSFKTAVNFVFSSGYLSKADAGQVADAITKVLVLENNGVPPGPPQGSPMQTAFNQGPPQGSLPQVQVELGMTEDQVRNILGQPTSQRQVARAKVYVYTKQVTFQNGVVTAIQ
jgi:SmpA / OmlA family